MIDLQHAKKTVANLSLEVLRRYADPKKRAAAASELKGAVDDMAAHLDKKLGTKPAPAKAAPAKPKGEEPPPAKPEEGT